MDQYPGQPPQYPSQPYGPHSQYSNQPYGQPPQYPSQPYGPPPQYPTDPYGQPPQYPNQPYGPPPRKKSNKTLWIVLAIILVVIIGSCSAFTIYAVNAGRTIANTAATAVATSAQSTPTLAATQAANNGQQTNGGQQTNSGSHHKIGEVIKASATWEITLNAARTSNGDEFTKPSAGNTFLIVNVTVHNISSTESTISSLLDFSVKDSTGTKGSFAILTTGVDPSPDGKVEAGGKIKGDLTYEISASQKSLTLSFDDIIDNNGQTIWDLSV